MPSIIPTKLNSIKNRLRLGSKIDSWSEIFIEFNLASTELRLLKKDSLSEIFKENDKVIKIIEWPEIIKKTIADRLEITFYYQEEQESRKLKIKGYGKWKKFKLNAI